VSECTVRIFSGWTIAAAISHEILRMRLFRISHGVCISYSVDRILQFKVPESQSVKKTDMGSYVTESMRQKVRCCGGLLSVLSFETCPQDVLQYQCQQLGA